VKQKGQEVPLIIVANAISRESAVVIPLENANIAQSAVPGPRGN